MAINFSRFFDKDKACLNKSQKTELETILEGFLNTLVSPVTNPYTFL